MVLEYLPTFARTKSPSYVVKYTSTMVCIWDDLRYESNGFLERVSTLTMFLPNPWHPAILGGM